MGRSGRRSGDLIPRIWIPDRLNCFEALELGMAEIERLVGAGVTMGGPKMLGLSPGGEDISVRPDRVRRIEHVIVALWPAQEMELEEPGHTVEMRVAREPNALERALGALDDLEAIHGNVHGDFPLGRRRGRHARELVGRTDSDRQTGIRVGVQGKLHCLQGNRVKKVGDKSRKC